jgi:aminoglycoside phosphotransferase (APT) family kinase protein
VSLESCLPPQLRGPTTTITRVGQGWSGAGVYRVDAAGQAYALKVAPADDPIDAWRRGLRVLELAANAGIAPRILHADEEQRAVVSAFVVDRGFFPLFATARERAIALLGDVLRRAHELPLPADPGTNHARDLLVAVAPGLADVPAYEVIRRVLDESPPATDRAPVLSHNDVNPTNLVFDGERLLLLDWDAAGANDPLYDLGTAAVFLRLDDAGCRALIAAHDRAPAVELPPRFVYDRRLAGVACGAGFLHFARASGTPRIDATPALADVYQKMRSGELSLDTPDGKWALGLALIGEVVQAPRA